MPHVVPLRDARDRGRFGGKAATLGDLMDLPGVCVPDGFAIDADGFVRTIEAVLPATQRPQSVLRGTAAACRPDWLESIRQKILSAPLPALLHREVIDAYRALGGGLVAVRSSALHEDVEASSAAGLQETVLGVEGEDAVAAAVMRCYASVFRERALTYLRRLRGRGEDVAIGVVVQRMVNADAAGVLFTVDPVSGSPDVAVVEASYGLGCAVVDGAISPDLYRLRRPGGEVLSVVVGEKSNAVRVRPGGGTCKLDTPMADRAKLCLSDQQVAELVRVGEIISARCGGPRDIEWAWEGRVLWVLQARPVVFPKGARAPDGAIERGAWVWSNVNVGEALPGVATPLTWSIAAAFSDVGFRRAFGALGCDVPADAELVGNFYGRIYLNLTAFVQIARQIPALSPRVLLELGGGGGLDAIERQFPPGAWVPFLARLPWTGARYLLENAGLDRRLTLFESDFNRARARMAGLALDGLKDTELASLIDDLRELLDKTGATMLTCASGYLASMIAMRGLLHMTVGVDKDRFERGLLAGFSDLESAAPGIRLFHIAEIARTEPEARAAILSTDPSSFRATSLPDGPTRRAFERFMDAYGYRCVREAELSTPRWREAPGALAVALRAYLLRTDETAFARVERQAAVRAAAELELADRLPPIARMAARHLLARTQRFARLRERMRARVTEVLGFFRSVALEVGARMVARNGFSSPDAAFFLRVDELQRWLSNELLDPVSLVAVRQAEVARDVARPDPPAVFVGSPPPTQLVNIPSGDRWTGVAASPGMVVAFARVLRDPTEGDTLRPGEVLVMRVADVGWTPLFLVAAAVVTELGGALSHAALVAREYGVPAVVNVQGATRAIRTGDRLRVDGDRGIVERVDLPPTVQPHVSGFAPL